MSTNRTYSELIKYATFEERLKYLSLRGIVGHATFGYERYLNQRFYKSSEWKDVRRFVISRDNGCDLGLKDYEIYGNIYIHHMNPMTVEDVESDLEKLLNPEYLISVSHTTHNAIHYGDLAKNKSLPTERTPQDTVLWKPIGGKDGI